MSRQEPALVSSVAVHKGSSIYLFKGHQPLFLFILPICGPGQISVLWILIGGDWVVIGVIGVIGVDMAARVMYNMEKNICSDLR